MSKIDLDNIKQRKQIKDLRNALDKVGWKTINEVERKFKGKPRWEVNDKTPNLIYTWIIQRNPVHPPIMIDFIAWFDWRTYDTLINDCSHCITWDANLELSFLRDNNLRNEKKKNEWRDQLKEFIDKLNEFEKLR